MDKCQNPCSMAPRDKYLHHAYKIVALIAIAFPFLPPFPLLLYRSALSCFSLVRFRAYFAIRYALIEDVVLNFDPWDLDSTLKTCGRLERSMTLQDPRDSCDRLKRVNVLCVILCAIWPVRGKLYRTYGVHTRRSYDDRRMEFVHVHALKLVEMVPCFCLPGV